MNASLIQLDGVSFMYETGRTVLDDLSIELRENERICVTGPNGSGKTTLLQLIMGLVRPVRGSVIVFGKRCDSEADYKAVRRQVGYVFQDTDSQLFCPTVWEDVAFGPLNLGLSNEDVAAVVDRTLDRLHLGDLRDRVTYRLSHGQKRLVALATVLAMQPRILLLDEPTLGLDERHQSRLIETLLELSQEMIIVSHDKAFIDVVATRTVELRDGRICQASNERVG